MKSLLCATLSAVFLAVAPQADAADFDNLTIRLAHTAAVSHAHHEAAQLFAKNVAERTGNKVKVEVYPAGELGDQPSLAEQVTLGALDMAVVSLGNMAMYSKKLNAMTAPFLFEDYDHAHRVIDGFVMDWMNQGLAEHDSVGLSMFDYGFRQTTTQDIVVNKAEDLKGVKIRVSPPLTRSAPTRSASPTPSSTRPSSRASSRPRKIPSSRFSPTHSLKPRISSRSRTTTSTARFCSPTRCSSTGSRPNFRPS